MKKNLLLIICFSLTFFIYGQPYYTLLNNSSWCVYWAADIGTGSMGNTKMSTLGDTMIYSNSYKIIVNEINQRICYVREDSVQKKVWSVYPSLPSYVGELLIYDFSLSQGDSIYLTNMNDLSIIHYAVTTVDSVLTNIGYRKHMQLTSSAYGLDWIEQVGSPINPFFFNYWSINSIFYALNCSYQNNALIYMHDSLNCMACQTVQITEPINNDINVAIYPNPATDKLIIESPQQATIEIANIQGQLIETLATTGTKTNIDISMLAKGMYFVKVKTEKGVAVKKFIKE